MYKNTHQPIGVRGLMVIYDDFSEIKSYDEITYHLQTIYTVKKLLIPS